MKSVLSARVGGERFERALSWTVGFGLLTACTTLTLKALPDLGLLVSGILIGGLGLSWVVLARFAPLRA